MFTVATGGAPVLRKLVTVSAVTDPAPPEAPGLRVPSSSITGSRSSVRLVPHSDSATTVGGPGHEFSWCGRAAGWCDGVGRGEAQGGGGGNGGGVGGDVGIGSYGGFDVGWSWEHEFSGFMGVGFGGGISFKFFGVFRIFRDSREGWDGWRASERGGGGGGLRRGGPGLSYGGTGSGRLGSWCWKSGCWRSRCWKSGW